MPQHYSDPRRESDEHALPDVEVFYVDANDAREAMGTAITDWCNCSFLDAPNVTPHHDGDCELHFNIESYTTEPGWYWWPCFPGCLPDGDPVGPFATEAEALVNAREGVCDDE